MAKKDRAPATLPDCAAVTLILDRSTGEVTLEFEPEFVREWEVRYALLEVARQISDDSDTDEDEDAEDYPFRFQL